MSGRARRAALVGTWLGGALFAGLGSFDSAAAPARGSHHAASAAGDAGCLVPRLRGLTLHAARARVARAGCRLRLRGARIQDGSIQTVGRQHPRVGLRAVTVTLVVNPLCIRSGLPGPPPGEPFVTPGPTELVSGIYLEGGPVVPYSAPRCAHKPGVPSAGTISVSKRNGGTVATPSVGQGQLATITLPPGSYTFIGRPVGGGSTFPQGFVVRAGKTVRQDVIVPLP